MSRPRLVIAGAGGVVGRHLIAAARDRYDITVLTRHRDGDAPQGVRVRVWNPRAAREEDDRAIGALAGVLDGARALVNLAGAPLSDGRLGSEHARRVVDSRVDSAATLIAANASAIAPVDVWFQASAVGFYGDRGDDLLTEHSAPGDDLLADTARAWEAAAQPAAELSRLLIGRFGLVLAEDAPAWQRLLLPIRLYVGGSLGSGRQWYAWIGADDLARAILWLIEDDEAEGIFNVTAPEPVRQVDLARHAAERLGRPLWTRVPGFALRLGLGGVADALVLPSIRALPQRLQSSGFTFSFPTIERMMTHLLPRTSEPA